MKTTTKKNDTFSVEHQYQLYLKRVKLDEYTMHPQQKIQLRQTFFGAIGQLIILMRDEVGALTEEQGVEALKQMLDEVMAYFAERIKQPQA